VPSVSHTIHGCSANVDVIVPTFPIALVEGIIVTEDAASNSSFCTHSYFFVFLGVAYFLDQYPNLISEVGILIIDVAQLQSKFFVLQFGLLKFIVIFLVIVKLGHFLIGLKVVVIFVGC
jgi:hypothetical protein